MFFIILQFVNTNTHKTQDTMLTIKQIRDDKQAAIRKLAKKGVDAAPVIARIETLDDRRKAIQTELDNTLAAQNKAAKEIGALMGQGRRDEAEERKRFVADLKENPTACRPNRTTCRRSCRQRSSRCPISRPTSCPKARPPRTTSS